MASRSRPAQGQNSIGYGGPAARRPKPAYRADAAPKVVSVGSQQYPKPNRWGTPSTLVADAAPRIVNL